MFAYLPRFILAAGCLGWSAVQASPPTDASTSFNLSEVAPGVFVHQGQHQSVDDPGRADSANIGFVVGNVCVAVIDSGGSTATGARLLSAIRARTELPICAVINTHGHFDHVLGNAAFVDEVPKFIGHANLAAAMNGSREFFAKNFAAELGAARDAAVIQPDTLVTDELVLDLGDRTLRLIANPIAHTDADLTVVDEQTRTLWSGDLLFMERLPVLDGKLTGWLAWMTGSAKEPYARVIPGHGPVSAPWPAALTAQREYLSALETTVRSALADGKFLEDVTAEGEQARLEAWAVRTAHPRNLSRVYRELEWE